MATVLLIGSGGREHAIAWKLAQSPKVKSVLVYPGNGGTVATDKIKVAEDCPSTKNADVVKYARENNVTLVVVGPEQPLVDGLVDELQAQNIKCFGPTKLAARLEGSKAFSKAFMVRNNIPTAEHKSFSDYDLAKAYIESVKHKVVIKASGLAAGKGVLLPETREETFSDLKLVMVDKAFGEDACKEVVIEERMEGPEVSLLAFTDGTNIVMMPGAQDHKRALDGDQGLNTGGMGAYAPAPVFTSEIREFVKTRIVQPTIDACKKEGFEYAGVLYAGLMLTPTGPKVVEFNCRFGDPETQVVLPLLKSDLYDIMMACAERTLSKLSVEWHKGAVATVVAASKGYPNSYPKGLEISGLNHKDWEHNSNVIVFHAGTKRDSNNKVFTSGGRVLAVTARSSSIREALQLSYRRISDISFDGMHYRNDIGWRALQDEQRQVLRETVRNQVAVVKDNSQLVATIALLGGIAGFLIGRYVHN